MVRMKITADTEILREMEQRFSAMSTAQSMPATAAAMKKAAALVQETWMGYATGKVELKGVPPMKNPSRSYAAGISQKPNGPFDYAIVNPSKIAEYLEYGTDEFDMKSGLGQYRRSRMTRGKKHRDGTWKEAPHPYLIVPFRWGTPKSVGFQNIMPTGIYEVVKKAKFEKSLVGDSTHNEPNARGEDVDRWNYEKWGSRLNMRQIINADDGGMNINQMFNMSGMVRMDTSSKNKKYSGYYTFRVISSKSPPSSWIRPATPARHITDGVAKEAEEGVNNLLEEAFRRDLGL